MFDSNGGKMARRKKILSFENFGNWGARKNNSTALLTSMVCHYLHPWLFVGPFKDLRISIAYPTPCFYNGMPLVSQIGDFEKFDHKSHHSVFFLEHIIATFLLSNFNRIIFVLRVSHPLRFKKIIFSSRFK